MPDTWGIAGPDFLWIYGVTLALSWLAAIAVISLVRWRPSIGEPAILTPVEASILGHWSQNQTHVLTALAYLRAAGAVETAEPPDNRLVAVFGRLPDGAGPLEVAALRAVANGASSVQKLSVDAHVQQVIKKISADLDARELLEPAKYRRWRALGGLWFVPSVVFGLARLIAGTENGHPTGFLIAMVILNFFSMLIATLIGASHRIGPPAKAAIALMKRRMGDQAKPADTAWPTVGPLAAAASVAVFGVAAVWAADPAMASAAGLTQSSSGSGGGGGCGGGGGGCGGCGGCGG